MGTVPVHVTKQNAGMIIRAAQDTVVFEMFELCPDNKSVMTTGGRLVRQFPAAAIAVPSETSQDHEF